MNEDGQVYLGDGVYLSRCPYDWVLTANGLPSECTDRVYLEPKVAERLVKVLLSELEVINERTD